MNNWTIDQLNQSIHTQQMEELFADIYGTGKDHDAAIRRIQALIQKAAFKPTHLFSAPGRTELGGNHTDHNLGKVLCAAVGKDALAAVSTNDEQVVRIWSEGFAGCFEVDIQDLNIHPEEAGTTNSLIRGVLAGIVAAGGKVGGLDAQITSSVGVGSGLSSSASFEVLLGTIVNDLFNEGDFSPEAIAGIGQFAENSFFGKPCGLMDQTASAVAGIIQIDFQNPEDPLIRKVPFQLDQTPYVLLVVDSGSSHADLTPAYAAIPAEMITIATALGAKHLRELDEKVFQTRQADLRKTYGDRMVLRANHFFSENRRVDSMVAALEENDFDGYLQQIAASGASSQNILQNTIPPQSDGREQGVAYALGLSQLFIESKGRGVARVHGGGFAGTIQAYIHEDDMVDYEALMTLSFGVDAMEILRIRNSGACLILELN